MASATLAFRPNRWWTSAIRNRSGDMAIPISPSFTTDTSPITTSCAGAMSEHGVRFYTENDSEVVAIFLADKLRQGMTLRAALESMITDLDGSFSCLVATESPWRS